jgi:hypothetical protein
VLKTVSRSSPNKRADLLLHNFFFSQRMRFNNCSLLHEAHSILIYDSLVIENVTGVDFVIFLDGGDMQAVPSGQVSIIQYAWLDLISKAMFQSGSTQCTGGGGLV